MVDKINNFPINTNKVDELDFPNDNPLGRKLDELSRPILDDFISFSDRFDPSSAKPTFVERALTKIELFGGIGRIGNAIEQDDLDQNSGYQNSRMEIARYSTSQVAGIALGGLGLVAFGLTLGPVGLVAGVGGYLIGSKIGASTFDYIVGKSNK